MLRKNWYPCDEVGIVSIAGIGKMRSYGRESLKTIEEFSRLVVEMYDEVEAVIEGMEETSDIGPSERLCVLTNMLCSVALEIGLPESVFMKTVEVTYLMHSQDSPIEEGEVVH
jgi:hypothetical protein